MGGAGFTELQDDLQRVADKAWTEAMRPERDGLYRYMHGGEDHAYNHAGTRFDHEYLFLLSSMDPLIHQQAEQGIAPGEAAVKDVAHDDLAARQDDHGKEDQGQQAIFNMMQPPQPRRCRC